MAQKVNTPKGTRDFSPEELAKRQYIIQIIENQFKRYGFLPIETPAFENNETLLGKYGEEGDRLIFKILNSGDFLSKVDERYLADKDSQPLAGQITEKALRYDLTVPFARYVVQHQNEIVFPFKRYQIQPVWRADRPQKGRFREFYQCDADVVGARSIWQEAELVLLYDAVFSDLKLRGVKIKINHRKILSGMAQILEAEDKLVDFTIALDKLDKIGKDKVEEAWAAKGISPEKIERLRPLFEISGSFEDRLAQLNQFFSGVSVGLEGVAELASIYTALQGQVDCEIQLDVTLARGLDYYTGAIFEVAAPEQVGIGSIGGGGRYDNLTGIFGLPDLSGVGISFGLDRIYIALEALALFPDTIHQTTRVLFVNFGEEETAYAFEAVTRLRKNGVAAEFYPEAVKTKKQLTYADKRGIPFVVLSGEVERKAGKYTLKNMQTGAQELVDFSELIRKTSL